MKLGLRAHLVTIARHWAKVVLVILGAVMVTGAIGVLSSKVYVAETRILIMSRSPAARAAPSGFSEGFQNGSPEDQVLTQVAIFKSPLLAMQLAEELGPERVVAAMTWRWDWLRNLPRTWRGQAVIFLADWPPTRDMVLSLGIAIPTGRPAPATVGTAAGKISDNLHADGILRTDMFGAALASPDPAFAAKALNRMVEIYADHVVALNRPLRTAEIARSEAERLEVELRETERRLRDYTETNRILSLEKQKDQLIDRLSRVQDALAQARREQMETVSKIAEIGQRIALLPREEAVSVTTVPNPLIDRLNERLAGLETELLQYVAGSLAANKVRIEIDGIRDQLARTRNDVVGSETVGASVLYQQLQGNLAQEMAEQQAQIVRVEVLGQEMAEAEAELRRLDGLELEYNELRRTVDAKEEAYRYALQKREETTIADSLNLASNLSQVVQVEPAVQPAVPTSPRRFRLITLGLVVGSMFGFALAYVLEFSRRTVATQREAEIALGRPVIGLQYQPSLLRRRDAANRVELRRMISRLRQDMVEGKTRVLMLIAADRSAEPPRLAASLARALQDQGMATLLIRLVVPAPGKDGLRVAVLGQDEKPVRDPGDYIGQDARQTRRDTATITGPAGGQCKAVATLLRERRRLYDLIVIESADLDGFPEAINLAPMIDAVVPVVEADATPVPRVIDLAEQFVDAGAVVPGIVLTRQRRTHASWAFCWMAMMRLGGGPGAA